MKATGVGDDDGIQLRSFVDRERDLRDESGEDIDRARNVGRLADAVTVPV